MVKTTRNCELFEKKNIAKQNKNKQTNKQKRVFKNHFGESVDPILDDASVA